MLKDRAIPLVFQSGIEQKLDDNTMPLRVKDLLDAVFDDKNTIRLRPGTSSYSTSAISGTAVSSIKRVWPHLNSLMAETGPGLHRLTTAGSQQITTDPDIAISYSGNSRFRRAGQVTSSVSGSIPRWLTSGGIPTKGGCFDCAMNTAKTFSCWAWEERQTNGSGRMAVGIALQREGDKAIVARTLLTADGSFLVNAVRFSPRVVWGGSQFYVYYAACNENSPTLKILRTSVSTSAFTFGAEAQISSTGGGLTDVTDAVFDAVYCTNANNIILSLREHDANNILTYRISASDGATVASTTTTAVTGCESLSSIYTSDFGTDKVQVIFTDGTVDLRGLTFVASTGALAGGGVIHSFATGSRIGRVTGIDLTSSDADFTIFADYFETSYSSPPLATNRVLKIRTSKASCDLITSQGAYFEGWFLYGRPVLLPNSDVVLPMANLDPNGSSVFAIDGNSDASTLSNVWARVCLGEAGYIANEWQRAMRLPTAMLGSVDNTCIIPFTQWVADLQVAGNSIVTPSVVKRADVDFNSQLGHTEVNGLTLLAGACPHFFDGKMYFEAGAHNQPQVVSSTPGGGSQSIYMAALQEFQDAAGNLHTGQASQAQNIASNSTGTTGSFVFSRPPSLTVPRAVSEFRTLTNSEGPLFRAKDPNGLRVTDSAMSPTDPFLTVVPDALYSTGAAGEELPHDPCPAHRQSCSWDGRIWLAGCDDGYNVYFSQKIEEAFAPAFSLLLKRRVPATWGRVSAVSPQGDKLLVFCERRIGVIYGSGPTATGDQDNYSQVIPVVENMGCVWDAPNSVVSTPVGVWFQSPFGLRLLGSNGVARSDSHEVGAELDALLADANSSTNQLTAVMPPNFQQVWFFRGGTGAAVYVFDYQWMQFSRFSIGASSAAVVGSTVCFIRTSNSVAQFDSTLADDDGTRYTAAVTTSPLQMAGIQGFQRVRRVNIKGNSVAGESVIMSLQGVYDNSTATTLVSNATITASGDNWQAEHHLVQQKCQALGFIVFWKPDVSVTPPRPRLTGLTISVGVKLDRAKLPTKRV